MLSINFTTTDSENAVWRNERKVVIAHNLGCYPIVNVYDFERKPVYPVIRVVSKDAFSLEFSEMENDGGNDEWLCIVIPVSECTMEYEEDVEEQSLESSHVHYDPVPPELFDSESPDPRYSISH